MILTPDAVGSTLLQRVLTVQMLLSDFDKPVVNLHELTNGLSSYYSPELQAMILGKNFKIGYRQSLPQIVELLETHDHYKTSRLAHYHLVRRQDNFEDKKILYKHLNKNFFIIIAKRKNLLDYSLSWLLRNISKKNNVYSSTEKIESFIEMYKNPIVVDSERLINHLEAYKKFIHWANLNFDISSTFYYETHVPNLENYIVNLPIFANKQKKLWNDAFQISFQDFNKVHKSLSDIGTLALQKPNDVKLLTFDGNEQYNNLENVVVQHLPVAIQEHVNKHKNNYVKANTAIDSLVKSGILVTNIPVKKHTFAEKQAAIKNFDECVYVYNRWIQHNPTLGDPIETNQTLLGHESDDAMWSIKE